MQEKNKLGDRGKMQWRSCSTAETEELSRRLGRLLRGGEVIAMFGGLGMGKTAFVRGLARGLQVPEGEVSSPTFALVHSYEGRLTLHHFDMYRVDGWDDLYSTGFFDYLDSNAVLAVEWSENIEAALPENALYLEFARGDSDGERLLTLSGPAQVLADLQARLEK